MREVTEKDFRKDEFRDSDPKDYEFRKSDGHIVRKDRWERAIFSLNSILFPFSRDFEIDDLLNEVRRLKGLSSSLTEEDKS